MAQSSQLLQRKMQLVSGDDTLGSKVANANHAFIVRTADTIVES